MQAIVHYPQNCNCQKTLAENVAAIHVEAVLRKLQTIFCPKERINQIIKDRPWPSLAERSHRPHSHLKRHKAEEESIIAEAFKAKFLCYGWDGVYN